MKVKVEAKVFPDRIELTQNFEAPYLSADPIVNVHREILRLKDAAVRDALISLGWTPPSESKKLIETLEHIANPLKAMQTEAQESGYELRVDWAQKLSTCDVYLKELARSALDENEIAMAPSKARSLEAKTANAAMNAAMRNFIDNGNGTVSYKRPAPYSKNKESSDDQ